MTLETNHPKHDFVQLFRWICLKTPALRISIRSQLTHDCFEKAFYRSISITSRKHSARGNSWETVLKANRCNKDSVELSAWAWRGFLMTKITRKWYEKWITGTIVMSYYLENIEKMAHYVRFANDVVRCEWLELERHTHISITTT